MSSTWHPAQWHIHERRIWKRSYSDSSISSLCVWTAAHILEADDTFVKRKAGCLPLCHGQDQGQRRSLALSGLSVKTRDGKKKTEATLFPLGRECSEKPLTLLLFTAVVVEVVLCVSLSLVSCCSCFCCYFSVVFLFLSGISYLLLPFRCACVHVCAIVQVWVYTGRHIYFPEGLMSTCLYFTKN